MAIQAFTSVATLTSEPMNTKASILANLCNMVGEALRIPATELNVYAPFLEMGADSIVLIDVLRKVSTSYNIKLSVRQFFEELATLDALAAFLAEQAPAISPNAASHEQTSAAGVADASVTKLNNGASSDFVGALVAQGHQRTQYRGQQKRTLLADEAAPTMLTNALERIMTQQLQVVSQVISQQLEFLADGNGLNDAMADGETNDEAAFAEFVAPHEPTTNGQNGYAPGEVQTNSNLSGAGITHEQPTNRASTPPGQRTAPLAEGQTNGQATPVQKTAPVTPFAKPQIVEGPATSNLTPQQRAYLQDFIVRYTARTPQSKAWVQNYRPVLADNRASAGFRPSIKEMLYPLVAQRSQGSHLWDIDGNEYVDIAMGFGVHLFGHQPPFVVEAIQQQLGKGFQLGPQSFLAGQVAELIKELTGMERVAFNNSGTEAVMTALRLARTVTGRNKVAMFVGSYHGHYDGTLAAPNPGNLDSAAAPVSPGVTNSAVADVLVVEGYGDLAALEVIKAHAHELAVVVVEPVQSRRPDLQPVEFLRQLRQLTQSLGILLMFDEVITGFRVHPGGAQAVFGVRADLVTYGKVVGGGLPIGVVAGKAAVLDALDGGMWRFGDASYPPADTTFFAGTFCKHPLTMASTHAVLTHMKQQGPSLQAKLNERTAALANTVNAFFAEQQVPMKVAHFGSLFYFRFKGNMDLFFYHLVEKGIYLWEGRTCFLSTAHTDADLDLIIQAIKSTVADMQKGGFFAQERVM